MNSLKQKIPRSVENDGCKPVMNALMLRACSRNCRNDLRVTFAWVLPCRYVPRYDSGNATYFAVLSSRFGKRSK